MTFDEIDARYRAAVLTAAGEREPRDDPDAPDPTREQGEDGE